uniref:Thioesterase domain-containing protein n=1 Tax=Mycena chlorophos TaxID=658473 RepID=A0ABQ0LEJ6_MYCCL|nr:predicted protein [Mycena chlorophos]
MGEADNRGQIGLPTHDNVATVRPSPCCTSLPALPDRRIMHCVGSAARRPRRVSCCRGPSPAVSRDGFTSSSAMSPRYPRHHPRTRRRRHSLPSPQLHRRPDHRQAAGAQDVSVDMVGLRGRRSGSSSRARLSPLSAPAPYPLYPPACLSMRIYYSPVNLASGMMLLEARLVRYERGHVMTLAVYLGGCRMSVDGVGERTAEMTLWLQY